MEYREDDRVVPFECAIHLPVTYPQNVNEEEYDREWIMRMLRSMRETSIEGMVKVPDSTEITSIDIKGDNQTLVRVAHVRATAVYRKPRHLPIIDDWIDLYAFKDGSTFRGNNGEMMVLINGTCTMPLRFSPQGADADLPLTVLWEPNKAMSEDDILTANYDPQTGISALAMVQLEDNLHDALLEGAL